MDRMRCNQCFGHYTDKNTFYLTQCGHVYCYNCIVQAEKRCVQCGQVGTISLPLQPTSPKVSHYFTDPSEQLQKIIQSSIFQEQQRAIYLQRYDTLNEKYISLKQAYWALNENMKKTMNKYKQLKISYMNMLQKENQQQTPIQIRPAPRQYLEMQPQKMNNNSQTYPRSFFVQETPNNCKGNDGVFKVPSSRSVPRSAGYFTSSSRSSNSSFAHN